VLAAAASVPTSTTAATATAPSTTVAPTATVTSAVETTTTLEQTTTTAAPTTTTLSEAAVRSSFVAYAKKIALKKWFTASNQGSPVPKGITLNVSPVAMARDSDGVWWGAASVDDSENAFAGCEFMAKLVSGSWKLVFCDDDGMWIEEVTHYPSQLLKAWNRVTS
jgi:hypothetical protein